MKTGGYESDQRAIFLVLSVKVAEGQTSLSTTAVQSDWDRNPQVSVFGPSRSLVIDNFQSICFSGDGSGLYTVVEEEGYGRLYKIMIKPDYSMEPQQLTTNGYVSGMALHNDVVVLY